LPEYRSLLPLLWAAQLTLIRQNGDYFKRMTVNPVIMAVDEVNAKGGVRGQKVEVVVEDHKGNAATALAVARKFIEIDKVSMISISVSPAVLATLPVAEENHVLVMSVAQHPKIAESPWGARSSPAAPLYGVIAARWAYTTMGARTAATLAENNDAMRLMIGAFKKEFEALGGKVLDEELYNSEDQDYKAQLTKVRGANPDVVSIIIDPQVREIAGNLVSGIYYTVVDFDHDWNEKVFKPRFGYDADGFAARIYDGVRIYLGAVEKAGTTDPVKIRDTLRRFQNFHGVIGAWGYNGSGDPNMLPVMKRVP
jgi:branched-chain amino acid transport system substrate-binding protein